MSSVRDLSKTKRRPFKVFRRIKALLFFDKTRVIYHGDSFESFWEEYYADAHRNCFSAFKIKLQARRAYLDDGFRLDEFYLLDLENKKKKERDLFLSRNKKDEFLISYYGPEWHRILGQLMDKYSFYTSLNAFFKREAIIISSSEDRSSFLSFCGRYPHIFAKRDKGSCGIGAKSFTVYDDKQAGKVFDELVASGEWIIEEMIHQDPLISAFNASSINTVRYPSFKHNGVVKSVFPCMRFGRAGSIIDNSTLGGLTVAIDEKTGEFFPYAYDEKGNVHEVHPDSKIPFRGFHVPQWDVLIEFVRKAHLALPDDQVYVAFDLAFSEKGWCIVEGNWGDWFLQQFTRKRGLKKEFVSLLRGYDNQ